MKYIHRLDAEFLQYFHTPDVFQDYTASMVLEKYVLDFDKFDGWCILQHGYNIDKHGSLKDFITEKFGKPAMDFLYKILEIT